MEVTCTSWHDPLRVGPTTVACMTAEDPLPLAGSDRPTGWEHRIEQVTVTDKWETSRQQQKLEQFRQELDLLGRHGWELVEYNVNDHVIPNGASTAAAATHLAVLKRATGRAPIPEPALFAADQPAPEPHEVWASAETLAALLTRWEEARGPVPDELEQLLEAQTFLPEDDWSLIVPCRDRNSAVDDGHALLAVGTSWWIIVGFDDGRGRVRVGDLSALARIARDTDELDLCDIDGRTEALGFESERIANRTAAFIESRLQALSGD